MLTVRRPACGLAAFALDTSLSHGEFPSMGVRMGVKIRASFFQVGIRPVGLRAGKASCDRVALPGGLLMNNSCPLWLISVLVKRLE